MTAPISLALFRVNIALTHKAFADFSEEQMRAQPAPEMNPPIWILGHMCVGLDGALRLQGQRPLCSPDYRQYFGPGSKIEELPPQLPTKKEMLAKLGEISELLLATAAKLPTDYWNGPNPSKFLTAELPTIRDMVSHLMFTHHAMHLGQLTVCRRLLGLPSMIQM
jgi:hypothetical protein